MEGADNMASQKTASLDSGLIARKGEAAPATVGSPRQEPIAVTVKLAPELYWKLKHYGMRSKPRKTNQEVLVEALQAFLQQIEDAEGAL
jgi:hypothetical protein